MNIFVLGGTGRTGRLVISDALRRGHSVSALTRARLAPRDGLRVVRGHPRDVDALSRLIPEHDAVVSCLGQRSAQDATLLRESARATIAAMTAANVKRLLVISQGLLFPSSSFMVPILRRFLARHMADSIAMEEVVSRSSLDWTIVRPPLLIQANLRRGYRIAVDAMPERSIALTRVDLATLLLDEVDASPHVRSILGVGSR